MIVNTIIFLGVLLISLDNLVVIIATLCKENESEVQVLDKQIMSNGCSKPAMITVEGEEDFTYCCDRHDVCYGTCGMSKDYCDNDFKKCMIDLCDTIYKSNSKCSQAANIYAMGTQMFGETGYQQSQSDFCTCIDSSKVYNHYATLIDQFYKKYVPLDKRKTGESILKSSKLAKNTGTVDKPKYKSINKIYYNLHKKYDNSIGHEGSRVGKKPPKPTVSKDEL